MEMKVTTTIKKHTSPNQEDVNDHHPQQLHHLPMASISLSLSSSSSSSIQNILNRFLSPSSKPSFSAIQSNLKIPSQLSSLSLSSSSSSSSSSHHCSNSLSSSFSFLSSLSPYFRRRPSDPSAGGAAARRCTLVWFRADLRLHDNEALSAASAASLSLLPVFLFDPRDLPKPSAADGARAQQRARFLIDAVADLRRRLRDRGSDLVVRVGRPEVVLPELARAVGADAVHAHRGLTRGEARAEESVAEAMEAEGLEVKYFWESTLYHIDDLPFDVEHMPAEYEGFKEKMEAVAVRDAMEVPEDVKGLPARGNVEPGDIPSLQELGFNPELISSQDEKLASPLGGETEALERLKKYAAECHAQPKMENKNSTRDSIYGASFSSKISPWLTTGCLSPRFIFEELKKNTTSVVSSAIEVDNEMKWLKSELLLRDFFRFTTKKYNSTKKIDVVPATACAGV